MSKSSRTPAPGTPGHTHLPPALSSLLGTGVRDDVPEIEVVIDPKAKPNEILGLPREPALVRATAYGVRKVEHGWEAVRYTILPDGVKIEAFLEKPPDPPGIPGNEEQSYVSMGNYIFSTEALVESLRVDANDDDSQHLLDLLDGLRDEGITSVIISHKLGEVTKISDTVTVLRDGKTIETLPAEGLSEERIISGMVGRDLEHRFPPRTPDVGEEVLRIEDWTVHSPAQPVDWARPWTSMQVAKIGKVA